MSNEAAVISRLQDRINEVHAMTLSVAIAYIEEGDIERGINLLRRMKDNFATQDEGDDE